MIHERIVVMGRHLSVVGFLVSFVEVVGRVECRFVRWRMIEHAAHDHRLSTRVEGLHNMMVLQLNVGHRLWVWLLLLLMWILEGALSCISLLGWITQVSVVQCVTLVSLDCVESIQTVGALRLEVVSVVIAEVAAL